MKYDVTKTLDFQHEKYRLCKVIQSCEVCPLHGHHCQIEYITQEDLDILQKWSNENPPLPKLLKTERCFLLFFSWSEGMWIRRMGNTLVLETVFADTGESTRIPLNQAMFDFVKDGERWSFRDLLSLKDKG